MMVGCLMDGSAKNSSPEKQVLGISEQVKYVQSQESDSNTAWNMKNSRWFDLNTYYISS